VRRWVARKSTRSAASARADLGGGAGAEAEAEAEAGVGAGTGAEAEAGTDAGAGAATRWGAGAGAPQPATATIHPTSDVIPRRTAWSVLVFPPAGQGTDQALARKLAGSAAGTVKRNVLPCPSVLSAQILPPCASTIPLAIARPNPEPNLAVSLACQ
jgi:hypothetical protein